LYELIREPQPEEPEYWERQQPERLEKPIEIGNETQYVRRWETVTIEGVGDQADRDVDVEVSHWKMTGPALRGYLLYMVGTLTPFEEALVRGRGDVPSKFTPVAAGGQLGYYVESEIYGARKHTIFNRDGTIFESWFPDPALINEGIGPGILALPGIGLRGL